MPRHRPQPGLDSGRPAAWAAGLWLACALACGSGELRSDRPLRLAAVRQPATALPFVAEGAGCFGREGLVLDLRTFDLGRDALASLREGGADVAVAFESVVVRAAEADPRLRVLSALHHSSRNTRLVALAGSGIESFADLAGKRVGVASGTNAAFFVDLVLRFGGVARSAVRVVDLPPEASAAALAAGTLDAAVLSDPVASGAERALGGSARALYSDLYVEFLLLTTRTDVLAERTPELRALLRGLACGERQAHADPAAALAHVQRWVPEQDREALRAQLARVRWGLGLDNVLLEVLRREREWSTVAAPGAPRRPRDLLAPRLLDEVDPESVMLLPPRGPGG